MDDSIFAKIVRGNIPAHKIYEDDMTLAFLDVYPKTPGHTLVIPKKNPAKFVWDLDADTYTAIMATSKKVALRLRSSLNTPYVHQAVIGVDVPYAHVHLVPFTTTNELESSPDMSREPDHESLASLAEMLRIDD